MTRPPRPKYPSDAKNYHDLRRPGFACMFKLLSPLVVPDFQHPAAEEHGANVGIMEDPRAESAEDLSDDELAE
ncbi:hypothetical protein R1sor_013255 [Riccia sorocarpa]|uniref:Uncharacterized protein n=1 Tax=Riccia sorocarpa TaxID=122646 RepID=A0ABD3H7W1_9MARC